MLMKIDTRMGEKRVIQTFAHSTLATVLRLQIYTLISNSAHCLTPLWWPAYIPFADLGALWVGASRYSLT